MKPSRGSAGAPCSVANKYEETASLETEGPAAAAAGPIDAAFLAQRVNSR